MKGLGGLLMLVAMVMQTILGYQIINTVLPTWITFWAISTTLTYVGFLFTSLVGSE